MGEIIRAPDVIRAEGPVIFLAGPIQGTPPWQEEAIIFIHRLDSTLHIASPRRAIKACGDFAEDMYNEQVDWETKYLNRAAECGAIMFWLAAEREHHCDRSYAQTTRIELAEWKEKQMRSAVKLAVGIEEGFTGARYIRRRFMQDCPDIPIMNTLQETCRKAVELATLP